MPRDSQDIAPVRRYQTAPRDPHDWLRASSSVVWVYTPALQPLSHGYMSKDPHLRSYGATRRVFHSKINSCDWSNTSVRCGGQLSRFEFWRFDTASRGFWRFHTASRGFARLLAVCGGLTRLRTASYGFFNFVRLLATCFCIGSMGVLCNSTMC